MRVWKRENLFRISQIVDTDYIFRLRNMFIYYETRESYAIKRSSNWRNEQMLIEGYIKIPVKNNIQSLANK